MSDKDPLFEWNRLNKENAEQEFASAFFGMTSTSPLADKFSMWLFAGTGATSALLITQISTIIESLGFYSIRINFQRRIIFRWFQNSAIDVQITDYH